MSRRELNIRGVPDWLVRKYLVELGAREEASEPPRFTGFEAGGRYSVSWSSERVELPGALRLTQLNIVLTGDEAAISVLEPRLMQKLQRGGG